MRPFLPRFPLSIALLAVVALGGPAYAQPQAHWVSLDDHLGAPDYPFGLNVTPDGAFYHVAIAGTFSSNGSSSLLRDRSSSVSRASRLFRSSSKLRLLWSALSSRYPASRAICWRSFW